MANYNSTYTPHSWTNGSAPALSASNMSEIDTFIQTLDERTKDLNSRQGTITSETLAQIALAPTYAQDATASATSAHASAVSAQSYADQARQTDVGQLVPRVQTLEDNANSVVVLTSADNLNNITDTSRKYAVTAGSYPTNSPTTTSSYNLRVDYDQLDSTVRRRQTVKVVNSNIEYVRFKSYSGEWGAWTKIDNDDTGWINTSPNDGGHSISYRKVGKVVYVRRKSTSSVTVSSETLLGNLPSGYRPSQACVYGSVGTASNGKAYIIITTAGNVSVFSPDGYIWAFHVCFVLG